MKQEIPFQIEHLVNSLLNQKENVYVRQNYRQRLINIQEVLDKAIRLYDNELYMANSKRKKA